MAGLQRMMPIPASTSQTSTTISQNLTLPTTSQNLPDIKLNTASTTSTSDNSIISSQLEESEDDLIIRRSSSRLSNISTSSSQSDITYLLDQVRINTPNSLEN